MDEFKGYLPGHTLAFEGIYARQNPVWSMGVSGDGQAGCSCGAMSATLPSSTSRRRWHRQHKASILAARGVKPVVKPTIVCLCGSTRFYDEFQRANYERTMAGEIVLSVGFYPHATAAHGHGEGVGHDSEQKVALDELHKRKIDLADYVLVLNVGGYIGESTRSEIDYAVRQRKTVRYLEDPRSAPSSSYP